MSFIDSIIDFGSNIAGALSGNSILGGVAKSAGLSFLLNQIQSSINKDNSKTAASATPRPDRGARVQVSPSTDNAIPIVYGTTHLGGILTDAFLSADKKTMYYCLTLCEKTGTQLSTGTMSQQFIDAVYWGDKRINFKSDGVTLESIQDAGGNVVQDYDGLIKINCFSSNSDTPIAVTGLTNPGQAAYNIMPNWDSAFDMNDLVFAVVRIEYNAEKKITGIGDLKFKVRNTMTQPGDVIYDYMTNTRYGGGLAPAEINI
jgi:hypothetical protein